MTVSLSAASELFLEIDGIVRPLQSGQHSSWQSRESAQTGWSLRMHTLHTTATDGLLASMCTLLFTDTRQLDVVHVTDSDTH